MIVVDTNLLSAFCTPSSRTVLAEQVWNIDPDWHAPALWISEFRNVMIMHIRRKLLPAASWAPAMEKARRAIPVENSHNLDDVKVMELSIQSGCTAYDCEFVALAESLNLLLITYDGLVLKRFPQRAITPESFVEYHKRKKH